MIDINALQITVRRGGVNVPIPNLDQAQSIEYATQYPGGLYADCSFFLPGDTRVPCQLAELDFVQIWCGLALAWEGDVTAIEASAQGGAVGWRVSCLGWWAQRLMARKVAKAWADKRYGEEAWPISYGGQHYKFEVDRQNRIHATTKQGVSYANNDFIYFAQYITPAGQTIKRITYNWELAEGAQAWALVLLDWTNTAYLHTVTASGSGTQDITLATPSRNLIFYMQSQAAQTGVGDDTVYAEVSNITVYTETGAINPQEIVKDCAALGGLSSDLSAVGALTDSIVPYIALPAKSLADIVTEVAAFGDGSLASWSVYVDKSTNASTGIPRMALRPTVPLTQRNFQIQIDAPNVDAGIRFTQDVSEVVNYYHVSYTDGFGKEQYLSPYDDAGLKDDASINAYGTRHSDNLSVNTTDPDLAKRYAKTKLAQTKELRWKASGDIVVTGWLENVTGALYPAAIIESGVTLLVTNYLNAGAGGIPLLITGTRYNHDERRVFISTGYPDTVEAWLARELRGRV